jgi:hypothetical protein
MVLLFLAIVVAAAWVLLGLFWVGVFLYRLSYFSVRGFRKAIDALFRDWLY